MFKPISLLSRLGELRDAQASWTRSGLSPKTCFVSENLRDQT
jgi:hypothetical protein